MRRILVVGGLVVLLAAAIVVPAMAQPSDEDSSFFDRFLSTLAPTLPLSSLLNNEEVLDLLGLPRDTDEVISPITRNTSEENPGVSSSSSSNPDRSNSSDLLIVDPNASDPDAAASQEFSERRITSGTASPSSSFSNTGDTVNACPTTQQVVNTGNVANQQGVVQYNSTADDIDFTGSSIAVDSSVTATCTQTIDQAAAAGK